MSQESSEKPQKRWKELHPECQEVDKGQATPVPSPSPEGANCEQEGAVGEGEGSRKTCWAPGSGRL